jgi:hypothetical protein
MPIHVTWGNPEKTYTVFEFTGRWTWDDYHGAVKAGYEMVKDVPQTVNILLDIRNSNLFPSNMLSHFRTSMDRPPKQFDLAVVVSNSGFVQAIARIIDTLYGKKGVSFKIVKTIEEAEALFKAHDQQNVSTGSIPSGS